MENNTEGDTTNKGDIIYSIDTFKKLSDSLLWEFNRDFYKKAGTKAWSEGNVPFEITSNSKVGKTYAELIFGILLDLADTGCKEKVYILELGAGHGRLSFHILRHLENLVLNYNKAIPDYCFIISDFVDSSIDFYLSHPQLLPYFNKGILDVAIFDLGHSESINLQYRKIQIVNQSLAQPLIVLANYFFDSIPVDLFTIQKGQISNVLVSLDSRSKATELSTEEFLKSLIINYSTHAQGSAYSDDKVWNTILGNHSSLPENTFFNFPKGALAGLETLDTFSKNGMIVITMDKGLHSLEELANKELPHLVTHGSFSYTVNFHALSQHCQKKGGEAWMPEGISPGIQISCLWYLQNSSRFTNTKQSFKRYVIDFGPDDFSMLKRFVFKHVQKMSLIEYLAILKLAAYDSILFINLLPRLKQLILEISHKDRALLKTALDEVWGMYFSIYEKFDLAFEIGGILYALGYFQESITFFDYSKRLFGHTADEYYNRILCHYELRQDELFVTCLRDAKLKYPNFTKFEHLDKLNLNAK